MKKTLGFISIIITILFISGCSEKGTVDNATKINQQQTINQTENTTGKEYNPVINPADFSSQVTNRYFALTPGKNYIFEGKTEDGTERNEVYVTNDTKEILGIRTVTVWDRVWLDGELIEETYDWYAQDKEGNVWYFGEDSKEMLDGRIVNTGGSWEAGVDGAKPGIIMEANPKIGDSYRQEYYAGEAEDMAEIVSLNESVRVPYGNFTDCLKTRDWTPLEPGADESKYFCPKIGGVVLEVVIENGERMELINVTDGPRIMPLYNMTDEPQQNITEEQAKNIALTEVPGVVTDVEIERKNGIISYVIQIDADDGPETDVIIDSNTGEVLGVET